MKEIRWDSRAKKHIIETYDADPKGWAQKNKKVVDEDIIGQQVVISNYSDLKSISDSFIKNQVYVVEKISKGITTAGKVKFEGVKGYYKIDKFTPVENKPALFRDLRIRGLFADEQSRRIDTMPNKNRVLIQLFIAKFQERIGVDGDNGAASISYDIIVENLIKSFPKYQLTPDDYTSIGDLTFREIVDAFVAETNEEIF